MTSIERTAYLRFKQNISKKELATIYTVTHEENIFARRIARGERSVFICLVMLKSFQRLGDFPRPKEIPPIVLLHIQSGLHTPDEVEIKFKSDVSTSKRNLSVFTSLYIWQRCFAHNNKSYL